MKHATSKVLDQLEPLLERLRELEGLSERRRGIFYHRSRAFLHFHEDPTGLYADVRLAGDDFERFKVDDREQCEALLKAAVVALGSRTRAR
jgi:hypothetical protein